MLDTSTITQSLLDGGGGSVAPEVDDVVLDTASFAEPDANAIISRFSTLERELKQVRPRCCHSRATAASVCTRLLPSRR